MIFTNPRIVRYQGFWNGSVACANCGYALTSGWSEGKCKSYPYYYCHKHGCELRGKSIAGAKLHDGFEDILRKLEPTKPLKELTVSMFHDCWEQLQRNADTLSKGHQLEASVVQKKIDGLLERIVDVSNPTVMKSFEQKNVELEQQKQILIEKADNPQRFAYTFDDLLEHSLEFLKNPYKLWTSSRFNLQRLVLRLGFSEKLVYCRETGFRTPKKPYCCLTHSSGVMRD